MPVPAMHAWPGAALVHPNLVEHAVSRQILTPLSTVFTKEGFWDVHDLVRGPVHSR